jgi:putative hydrolase of the HAD superfamily
MHKTIVFDLDDTIVKEVDYLKSAFKEISEHLDPGNKSIFSEMFRWYQDKEDVFSHLESKYKNAEKTTLIELYRSHYPKFDDINQNKDFLTTLKNKGHILGIITDGYSVTQRNKLKALEIESLFDLIIISEEFGSEKPDKNNFEVFHQFKTEGCFYVGDNVNKDFISPNLLGWTSICLLDDGNNIHKQDFDKDFIYLPQIKINAFSELNFE